MWGGGPEGFPLAEGGLTATPHFREGRRGFEAQLRGCALGVLRCFPPPSIPSLTSRCSLRVPHGFPPSLLPPPFPSAPPPPSRGPGVVRIALLGAPSPSAALRFAGGPCILQPCIPPPPSHRQPSRWPNPPLPPPSPPLTPLLPCRLSSETGGMGSS